MIESGPEMPEEEFLALKLGEIIEGWNWRGLPSEAINAAIQARPKYIEAGKQIANIVRLRDLAKKGES